MERRFQTSPDRRRVPRGGRRPTDRPGKHPNLLIAESYAGTRRVCVRYLEHFGFRVEEAGDGLEAIAKISADPPHAILVEHSLPGMPALEISRWLMQQPHLQGISLIVMTTEFEGGANAVFPTVVSLLVKPFPLAAMLEQIRQVLRSQITN
jgi:CheY-like chemotaxis protein